jgi:hypothetical protein
VRPKLVREAFVHQKPQRVQLLAVWWVLMQAPEQVLKQPWLKQVRVQEQAGLFCQAQEYAKTFSWAY